MPAFNTILKPAICWAFIACSLSPSGAIAQLRQSIDEELLSSMVMAKQEEIKQRAIRDLVRPSLDGSSLATYNTVLDLLDVLLKEKNKSAMTRDLVRIVGEHALAYATTWYFIKYQCPTCNAMPYSKERWFLTGSEAWSALRDKYAIHQRLVVQDNYERARTCGDPPYPIVLFNYLLDTISIQMRDPDGEAAKWLSRTGLFTRSSVREWQGVAHSKYKSLWRGDTLLRDSVHSALSEFTTKLAKDEISWQRIIQSIDKASAGVLTRINLKRITGARQWNEALAEHEVVNDQVAALFDLFRKAVELYRHDTGKNRIIARFADLLDKYLILDPEKADPLSRFGFTIDVEGVILSLEDRLKEGAASPTKRCFFNLRPYFTIGLNYGAHRTPFTGFADTAYAGLRTVAWAGEKLGLKWRIADFKYTRNQPMGEYFQYHGMMFRRTVRPKDPYISNVYMNLFASGLLYTVADLRSDADFRHPVLGLGAGLTWFNGLETNIGYVMPVISGATIDENLNAGFLNLALDIPLFEYIKAAREKRGK